jgi:hypothetical protein
MNKNRKMSKREYELSIKDINNVVSVLTTRTKRAIKNSEKYVYMPGGDALIICEALKKLIKYYRKEIRELEK